MEPWSEAAIGQNRRWLSAYILSLTGDPALVDGMVQEVFLVAYRKKDSFESGASFGGWLRGIARNVIRRYWTKVGRQPLFDRDEAIDRLDRIVAEAEHKHMDPDWAERMRAFLSECLEELSEKARQILRMRYGAGRTSEEVASALGQSVSNVNVTVFRARAALGDCLRRKDSA